MALPSNSRSLANSAAASGADVDSHDESSRSWSVLIVPFLVFVAAALASWIALGRRDIPGNRWFWFAGLALAALSSALAFQALRSQAHRDDQTRRHLKALEKLTEISASISARVDAPGEALSQLCRASCELLGMDRAGICLLDPAANTLTIIALAGDIELSLGGVYAIDTLPLCRTAMDTREELFLEDGVTPSIPANVDMLRRVRAGSMALLPLHVAGRLLGLLFISGAAPRRFSDRRRRLAKLLGSQAAVILGNRDLYQRMIDALHLQQRLFDQREAIFAVNAAVYQASSLDESLHLITELAPGVLEVDLCMVTLDAADNERALVASITPPHGVDFIGKTFHRKGTNGAVVRATRRTLVVEDAKTHPGVHPGFRDRLDVGSVAYFPLVRVGGEYFGTLVLMRHAAGAFHKEQLGLAEMFASRAAAAIENARLLDQTRRDADTKAMLLRELNHRVKNNLSSIITLLSLDEPELSSAARQWLSRAVDRIRNMARAHDLFAGGFDRVRLAELVEQVISSLSVVKPPAVNIQVKLGQGDILLRTDRAVSLAMVLHELCSNAILHGTASAGTILIRAAILDALEVARAGKTAAPRRLQMEIIDAGANPRPRRPMQALALLGESLTEDDFLSPDLVIPPPSPSIKPERVGSGGLGLVLVDGLVTRELGGKFCLTKLDDGGSVAQICFPIAADEPLPGRP